MRLLSFFFPRAGLIDLLQLISSEVIVPEAVASEIEIRGNNDPTAQILANTSWLLVTPTPLIPAQIQAWGLGPGESSVIAWARSHKGSEAIIDDLAGRRCASAFQYSGAWHSGLSVGSETTWSHSFSASAP